MKTILKFKKFFRFCNFFLYAVIFVVLVLLVYSLINNYVVKRLNNLWILFIIVCVTIVFIILIYFIIKFLDFLIIRKEERLNQLLNQDVVSKLTVNKNLVLLKIAKMDQSTLFLNHIANQYQDFEKYLLDDENIKPIFIFSEQKSGRTTFLKEVVHQNNKLFYFVIFDVRKQKYATTKTSISNSFLSYLRQLPFIDKNKEKSFISSGAKVFQVVINIMLSTLIKSKTSDFKTQETYLPFNDAEINVDNINKIIDNYNSTENANKICFIIDHLDYEEENQFFELIETINYFFIKQKSKFKFIISYDPSKLGNKGKIDMFLNSYESIFHLKNPCKNLKNNYWKDFFNSYFLKLSENKINNSELDHFYNLLVFYFKNRKTKPSYYLIIQLIDNFYLYHKNHRSSSISDYFDFLNLQKSIMKKKIIIK